MSIGSGLDNPVLFCKIWGCFIPFPNVPLIMRMIHCQSVILCQWYICNSSLYYVKDMNVKKMFVELIDFKYLMWSVHRCCIYASVNWIIIGSDNYINQCWIVANCARRNKLKWNFDRNTELYIHENAPENTVCEMVAILSREWEMSWVINWIAYKYRDTCGQNVQNSYNKVISPVRILG